MNAWLSAGPTDAEQRTCPMMGTKDDLRCLVNLEMNISCISSFSAADEATRWAMTWISSLSCWPWLWTVCCCCCCCVCGVRDRYIWWWFDTYDGLRGWWMMEKAMWEVKMRDRTYSKDACRGLPHMLWRSALDNPQLIVGSEDHRFPSSSQATVVGAIILDLSSTWPWFVVIACLLWRYMTNSMNMHTQEGQKWGPRRREGDHSSFHSHTHKSGRSISVTRSHRGDRCPLPRCSNRPLTLLHMRYVCVAVG